MFLLCLCLRYRLNEQTPNVFFYSHFDPHADPCNGYLLYCVIMYMYDTMLLLHIELVHYLVSEHASFFSVISEVAWSCLYGNLERDA